MDLFFQSKFASLIPPRRENIGIADFAIADVPKFSLIGV
jgi:hypothetical protein